MKYLINNYDTDKRWNADILDTQSTIWHIIKIHYIFLFTFSNWLLENSELPLWPPISWEPSWFQTQFLNYYWIRESCWALARNWRHKLSKIDMSLPSLGGKSRTDRKRTGNDNWVKYYASTMRGRKGHPFLEVASEWSREGRAWAGAQHLHHLSTTEVCPPSESHTAHLPYIISGIVTFYLCNKITNYWGQRRLRFSQPW